MRPGASHHVQKFWNEFRRSDYRSLDSLREVLLVDPDLRRCDLFRRQPVDGGEAWVLHPSAPGEGVELVSVGLEVTADALWAEVPALASPRSSGV
jgi:Uma2 family endonuclease